ncbi:Ig-like domain-containing protein [uncultured Nocardioides sp.]|uniref:Ig-like domain-containing protein n=1 Tax=uncultured Nocardioides sp. TaxID=198441 RepID=UPI00261E5FAB|nr:Ig-like domain-containing protein [uncultured Nocardioides sp.]
MSQHRATRRSRVVGRPPRRLLGVLVVALVVAGTTWFSGASFTSASFAGVSVNAAADYHPPKVTLHDPAAVVNGTVTLTATGTDTGSGVKQVVFQQALAPSGAWVTLCTSTAAPYSCAWDTTTVLDGDHLLRAVATDHAGFTATSATATTKVQNAAAVVLADIPAAVRGTVALSATVSGAGTRSVSSRFQHMVDGATTWTTITGCATVSGTAPTCSWNTAGLTDVYDIRVVSTVGTTVVSDALLDVVVDNTAPTVSVSAPSPMSGTVQVVATPFDADSGIRNVELSYRRSGTTTWTVLCTVATDPHRCALNTTTLTNLANYDLRGIATDHAGNTTTSATITRQVNNGLASVTITAPLGGDTVRGTTSVTTDTATPIGTNVTRVVVEARPTGGTYSTVCTATSAPWSCPWSTASLSAGSWDLRATMTYTGGLTATSPVVTVVVDNFPVRALDVQATNGGTLGRADAGDTLVLTYEGAVDLTSVKSGWTGASTALTVNLLDKNVSPVSATDRATFSVNLGTVSFGQNYVKSNKSVAIPATMTATTSTVDGTTTTVIVITFGTTTSNDLRTASATGTMRWTPSGTVRSVGGGLGSTTPATESGVLDRDL